MSRLLLILLALSGCEFAGAEASGEILGDNLALSTAARVEAVTLHQTNAQVSMSIPGEVVGSQDAMLAAGNGGTVDRVLVTRGETVRKGQAIARVDTELYASTLDQATAQHEQALGDLKRTKLLGDLASAAQLQGVHTAERIAAANLRRAKAQMSRAVVSAPFAGIIADLFVDPGEATGPGSPVARLVQLDPARVVLSVADRDIGNLKNGMEVTVSTSAQSALLPGFITHIGPAADLSTRAFPVEVEVKNPDQELLAGMIARVEVHQEVVSDAIVIPQQWIVTQREERGVFLVDNGVARYRPIVLGQVVRNQVVVLSGLSTGDQIVMTGHRDLVDGDPLLISRQGSCCVDGRPVWGE